MLSILKIIMIIISNNASLENRSRDELVKDFLNKTPSTKLVTKFIQVVLHHPFTYHIVGLKEFLCVTKNNMNPFDIKINSFNSRDFYDLNINTITQI